MTALYSTCGHRDGNSFSYWQDVVSSIYTPSKNRQLSSHEFEAELAVKSWGAATFSKIKSRPIEYHCDSLETYTNQIFISLSLSTNTFVTQGGLTSEQKPGEMVIYDGSRPFTCHFPEGDDQIVLAVPNELFYLHVPSTERFLGKTLSLSSPMNRLLSSLIQESWNIDEQVLSSGNSLLLPILDIVNNAFTTNFINDQTMTSRHHSELITRAKNFLLDNLDNREITLDTIADAVHVSSRTLNRVFAREGTTAMRWFWQERLKACHKALQNGQFQNVSDVALTYGFSNLSHFSRVFKSTFGHTPNQTLSK